MFLGTKGLVVVRLSTIANSRKKSMYSLFLLILLNGNSVNKKDAVTEYPNNHRMTEL